VTVNKLCSVFPDMVVYKSAEKNKFFSSLSIPSYLRDWLLRRYADKQGNVDVDIVHEYINQKIPRREQWESLKSEMVNNGACVRILAKVQAQVDVTSGEMLFSLPDLAFPSRKYEALVEPRLAREKRDLLLAAPETWGVIALEWHRATIVGRPEEGRVFLVDFRPFCPYKVDLEYYREARREFTLPEWVDLLLMAIDYNPMGFLTTEEKLTMLTRLLPFVEKRVNIVELAPKGTGKSYVFSQISKYGWLVSGGSVSRARLFYNVSRGTPGLVSRHDYVALDEIQSIKFPNEEEVRGALKGYMESGEYRVGDYSGVGEAGIVLLGNIDVTRMSDGKKLFAELPPTFQESALIDRFHGFIEGWSIPRMRENLKAEGWALNTEYFSEIMHALRGDIRYRAVVDEQLSVPRGADTRDTEAIKRLATGFLKLLFPHATKDGIVEISDFEQYCLEPAKRMRSIIRRQLHLIDEEYSSSIPDIRCKVPA